jgi:DNA adenine methylase
MSHQGASSLREDRAGGPSDLSRSASQPKALVPLRGAVRRPALRWHGGKWILAPWIISHLPKHRCYVEPFGGAASVLLRKPRSYAEVYNDLDDEVVNLFQVLRSTDAPRLIDLLRLTPFARSEFAESYEAAECPVERARRLVIRSFMGFGSNGHARKTGFRSNSNRSGTTPAHDWINYPDALAGIVERLQGVVIERRDATEVMRTHDAPETVHFVDPPYLPETRDKGRDYQHEMTVADHEALLSALLGMKGAVLVSGYPSALYDNALASWRRIERPSLADGARTRTEVLWINRAVDQLSMFVGETA